MPSEDSPPIDANIQRQDSHLADALIAGYWNDFESGRTRSYHGRPPRYVPGDRWATRDQWIAAARRCLETNTHLIRAYEILLAEGLTEYASDALALVQNWRDTSGHDQEYYYRLMAHLPDCDLRREYLNNEDADELLADDEARRALISVDDARTCELVAQQIVHDLSPVALDDELVRQTVIPRLVELGPLCRKYVPEAAMARAKQSCLEQLAKDRASFRAITGAEARGHGLHDEIAYVAWRLGWHDVLRDLEGHAWYWSSAFAFDSDNYTLLTWSLLVSNDTLKARASEVMRTYHAHRLDGAIAWVRLHAAPVESLSTPLHSR